MAKTKKQPTKKERKRRQQLKAKQESFRRVAKEWTPFERAELPKDYGDTVPGASLADELYVNSRYHVFLRTYVHPGLEAGEVLTHLSIKHNDKSIVHDWRDMQRIKNEICGEEREALEIYPAESRLVDTSNQYHLWVFPEGKMIPFGFFAGRLVTDEVLPNTKQRPHEEGTETMKLGDILNFPEYSRDA